MVNERLNPAYLWEALDSSVFAYTPLIETLDICVKRLFRVTILFREFIQVALKNQVVVECWWFGNGNTYLNVEHHNMQFFI